MAYGPQNPLDFGGNVDPVTLVLVLWLRLAFHVTPGRNVLPLGECQVIHDNTGYVLLVFDNKADCWALAEVCTLLSANLFNLFRYSYYEMENTDVHR